SHRTFLEKPHCQAHGTKVANTVRLTSLEFGASPAVGLSARQSQIVNSDPSADTLDTQALDALPVAICISDLEGRLIRCNACAVELWGRQLTSEDVERGPAAQVLRTGRAVRAVALSIERSDGSTITTQVSAKPIADARGETVAVLTTFVEHTGDEEAEWHRARLAAIVVSSDDAIVSKTLDGVVESWNIGAERIFGYTAEEAIGQHISLILPLDRHDEEADARARLLRCDTIDH